MNVDWKFKISYAYSSIIWNFPYFSDAVRDDEIENWAAKKIQYSFKQYKYQKTLSQDGGGPGTPTSGPPANAQSEEKRLSQVGE